MSDSSHNLISVNIDGHEHQVAPGTNMIDAAKEIGIEVPHYCYHPHLSVVGNCRMCLVELGMPGRDRATGAPLLNDDGSPQIMWMPKPAIACATKASPGLHMRTTTDAVKQCREGVMEFLLVNHPLDCPICDQAGECRLQEFATDYGRGYSRFVEHKNVKPKRTRLGPRVMLDDERCILCSRCIRFCDEIAKDPVLGFIDRGSFSTLTCFPGKELANNYSLNTVDLCPVGALTDIDFRFKMRVWFLKPTNSICTESSTGVNTQVWSREGKIYRITPRRNDAVNDTWMPDSGRRLFKNIEDDARMTTYSLEGRPCTADEAVRESVQLLRTGKPAIVASGRASVEEQWLLRQLADALPATDVPTFLVARHGQPDGFLISADRNPNTRGALLTGLIDNLPATRLDALAQLIDDGSIDTLLVHNECLFAAGLTREQLAKVRIIHLGTHHCESSQHAKVEIPVLSTFEKSGCFINQQFRLQKFLPAIPGPTGILPDTGLLLKILARLDDRATHGLSPLPDTLWEAIARAPATPFTGLTWRGIPDTGLLLDPGKCATLPFPEGPALHYAPATPAS